MMKTLFIALIAGLLPISVYAKLYKCIHDGKTRYQDKPCLNNQGQEFILRQDISHHEQQAARQQLTDELNLRAEQQRLAEEQRHTERLIRAEEAKASATMENALQAERQADALEKRNEIEHNRYSQPLYLYNSPGFRRYSPIAPYRSTGSPRRFPQSKPSGLNPPN